MYVIEQLKHNRIQQVDIPSGHDLYKVIGLREASSGKYSGEEYLNPNKSKVEMAAEVAKEIKEAENEQPA